MHSSSFVALVLALSAGTLPLLAQQSLPPGRSTELDPKLAVISGFVRYQDGDGIGSSVVVRLETVTGTFVNQAWTASAGRFEFFRVPRGSYVLAVNQPGYKPVRIPVELSYAPIAGILISLVPERGESLTAGGASVSVRQLQIPKKARKEYEKGLKAYAEKQVEKSVQHFRRAIEIFADYDDAYIQLGVAHLQRGDHGEARQVLEQAVGVNDHNARAYALLGIVYREQRQPHKAAEVLTRSLSLHESSWFAHLEFGRTLLRLRRFEEAYGHAVRAHELNAASPSTHVLLYDTLILRKEYGSALAELDEFLQLFPQHLLADQVREKRQALLKDLGSVK